MTLTANRFMTEKSTGIAEEARAVWRAAASSRERWSRIASQTSTGRLRSRCCCISLWFSAGVGRGGESGVTCEPSIPSHRSTETTHPRNSANVVPRAPHPRISSSNFASSFISLTSSPSSISSPAITAKPSSAPSRPIFCTKSAPAGDDSPRQSGSGLGARPLLNSCPMNPKPAWTSAPRAKAPGPSKYSFHPQVHWKARMTSLITIASASLSTSQACSNSLFIRCILMDMMQFTLPRQGVRCIRPTSPTSFNQYNHIADQRTYKIAMANIIHQGPLPQIYSRSHRHLALYPRRRGQEREENYARGVFI